MTLKINNINLELIKCKAGDRRHEKQTAEGVAVANADAVAAPDTVEVVPTTRPTATRDVNTRPSCTLAQ